MQFLDFNPFVNPFTNYHHHVCKTFAHLPYDGKISEIYKRIVLCLIAPLAYPVLGFVAGIGIAKERFYDMNKLAKNILMPDSKNYPSDEENKTLTNAISPDVKAAMNQLFGINDVTEKISFTDTIYNYSDFIEIEKMKDLKTITLGYMKGENYDNCLFLAIKVVRKDGNNPFTSYFIMHQAGQNSRDWIQLFGRKIKYGRPDFLKFFDLKHNIFIQNGKLARNLQLNKFQQLFRGEESEDLSGWKWQLSN